MLQITLPNNALCFDIKAFITNKSFFANEDIITNQAFITNKHLKFTCKIIVENQVLKYFDLALKILVLGIENTKAW